MQVGSKKVRKMGKNAQKVQKNAGNCKKSAKNCEKLTFFEHFFCTGLLK